jgi:DNA topoisomerase-2
VAANKEVKAIKEMLGLREGVDYTLPENLLTLRYGYVLITVDADSDGFHIASLIVNYFDKYYKGLLISGRIGILRTPVVRIKDNHDNVIHRFFSNADFEAWSEKNIIDGQMPKGLKKPFYYKGLGTSEDKDIVEDISTAPVVTIVYDEKAAESLFKAFDKSMADKRKEWISEWREVSQVEDVIFESVGEIKQQSITKFINRELINYTIDALFRAIPSFDDGLKRSQRQALYAGLIRFKYGRKNEPEKVARFAAFAANETNYHHGETSMCETVIKLAQDYIGANNLSLFNGVGQFGTRSEMGDDAASPRYISVNLPKYVTHLYDEELINIIPKRIIDGEEAEPIYVPAVIPIHIVNGANGIATGYSTTIPNHNYYDVINWLRERCNLVTKPNGGKIIEPWYKGFKGKIFMAGKEPEASIIDECDDGPDNLPAKVISKVNEKRFIHRGEYKITPIDKSGKVNIIIKELPIGVSFVSYRTWLNTLLFNKQIDDLSDESISLEEPHWVIKGMKVKSTSSVNYKTLKLEDGFTMSNFNLIDTNGYPVKFEDTTDIMEKYYERMVELYQKVKNQRLSDIQSKMLDLSYRIHFIKAVVDNKIVIFKRKKADILADMKAYNPSIPEKYLTDVRAHEFTDEELTQSYVDYNKLKELFETTSLLTPQKLWLEKLDALENYLKKHKF